VEKQGNGNYQWQERNLIHTAGNLESVGVLPITKIVFDLLGKGKLKLRKQNEKDPDCFLTVTKIENTDNWRNFKGFYGTNWNIKENIKVGGFTALRNELYHSLLGDSIDSLLQERTEALGSVTHPNHPAQVAIDYLNYIINLAGLTEEVQNRADNYRQLVRDIEENL
jgi:hypothetical protein